MTSPPPPVTLRTPITTRSGPLAVVGSAVALGACGLAACWVVVQTTGWIGGGTSSGPVTETITWRAVLVVAVAVAVAVPLLLGTCANRVPHESVVLGGTSALLGSSALAALHGTAWGFDGLYSDAGFRTEAVTRFADSPQLADYGYRGLAAYYPALWPWAQGRAADLLGTAPWAVMKPTQVIAGLVMAPLGWLLWRRVLPTRVAAWVAVSVAVLVASPNKPDQWLVLCLLLPWWLEVCRGVRDRSAAPLKVVPAGLVLGGLLLSHTYYFAPFAVATGVAMLADLQRRRPVTPRFPGALLVGAVGMVVAAPTWWHVAVAPAHDMSSDDLQRRWSPVGFDLPPHPLPTDPRGVLEAIALTWLVLAARHSKVAANLLLVLVTAYVFMVGGQLLQPYGLAVLPEKSSDLIEAVYAVAAVLGLHAAWTARPARSGGWWTNRPALLAATVIIGLLASGQSVARGMFDPARPSQSMRYPDGSFPAGGPTPSSSRWHPWGVEPGAEGPSVADVDAVWRDLAGRPLEAGDVLVTARADVAATVPVHLFVAWKSIYSHPNAEFERRVAHLRGLQACDTPACAAELLRRNPFDPVDGLILNLDEQGPFFSVAVDAFPDGWRRERMSVPRNLLVEPYFDVHEVSGVLVVRVR